MSDVSIRCPQCGTTQRALGECDACHEADARYFCANHTPGRWLDGPACAACGARFSDRATAGSPIPPAPLPPARPGAGRPAERRPAPPAPADAWERPTPPPSRPAGRRPTPPPPPRRAEPPVAFPPADIGPVDGGWAELEPPPRWPPSGEWVDRMRSRGRATGPVRLPVPVVRVGFGSVLGCVGRLVSFAIVLLALAAMAFFGYCGPIGFAGELLPRL